VSPLGKAGDGQTRDEARAVERLEALAARIGRDFATLLAPVLGNAKLLEAEIPDGHPLSVRMEGIRDATAAARMFAQRLTSLDPRRRFAPEPADLGALVRDCQPALRCELRPNITVTVTAAKLDAVRVDRKQMEHMLVELARNAQDAMPGGGTLAFDLDMVEGEGGEMPAGRWVRLRVRDSGRGMEPSLRSHAFEPSVTTKVPGSGAGLGLSIVAAVARQHGGFVLAESQLGAGTTLSTYWPSHASDSVETAPSAPAPPTALPTAEPAATILLVEDNAMVRKAIESTLRGAGYQVISVESGEICIETVKQMKEPPDLLITDVVMPHMTGKELIDRVHAWRPELPVLFISGYDRSTLAGRKQQIGSEHFLQKPFDFEDLFSAVGKALGKAAPEGK
jgi:two-component system, cell cycle sensor histidine kinase and response regulator CckA